MFKITMFKITMFKIFIISLILPLLLTVNFAYSKPSVFSIHNEDKGTKGTAFYIGEGKFVTNFHIVRFDTLVINKQLTYSINFLKFNNIFDLFFNELFNVYNNSIVLTKILHLDAKNDLAVLQVEPEFIQTLEEFMTPLRLSEEPNLNKNLKYKLIVIDYSNYNMATRKRHNIDSKFLTKDSQNFRIQFSSYTMERGMSGSPMLDQKKQVVGIVCCTNQSTGFAVPVVKLLDLLDTQPLECESHLECIKQEIQNLEKQANNNNIDALYELARYYKFGKGGMLKDFTKAISLFKRAIKYGHIGAQNDLAYIYRYEYNDLTKAIYWYEEAAKYGYIEAQYDLGNIYYTGEGGVPQDLTKAIYWYKKAAAQGNQLAKKALQKIKTTQ